MNTKPKKIERLPSYEMMQTGNLIESNRTERKIDEIIDALNWLLEEREEKKCLIPGCSKTILEHAQGAHYHKPIERESWAEELKRQCEIRSISFTDIKYLFGEVLLSEKKKWKEENITSIGSTFVEPTGRTCDVCHKREGTYEFHKCEGRDR